MLRNSEGETEILLGNKQLLGIFFVVVVLLGIAFAGGYKIGQNARRPITAPAGTEDAATKTTAGSGGGETHALPAESGSTTAGAADQNAAAGKPEDSGNIPLAKNAPEHQKTDLPLGSPERPKNTKASAERDLEASGPPPSSPVRTDFAPQSGQTFLQVAAVTPDEAEAIADVLRKKGFRAHAVQKPGVAKIFRVIIGPVRDASDLNNTRALLRNTGFREIFVQRY